jgi:hypothetical protein
MVWADTFLAALRAALLPLGLIVPGAALLAAARLPRTLGTSFVASAGLLFTLVLAFAWTRTPISGATLGAALGIITLAALVIARARRHSESQSGEDPEGVFTTSWLGELGPWTVLYAAIAVVLVLRLALQPLSGPDVVFRWAWLPEQMLRFGSLDFYPPRSGDDFARYFWAESIPPGVAGLYAWAQVCLPSPLGSSCVVALQFLALHEFIWRIAALVGGHTAGRAAVMLAAATPLLNWSLLIGQETGLTALGVTGLAWAFLQWRETREDRWLLLGGLAATVAASAREYGACYGAAGALALVVSRAPVRSVAVFALAAFAPVLGWFAWVAARTGNPVYSLEFLGAPVNPVFRDYLAHTRAQHGGALAGVAGWSELARHLVRWALPALIGLATLGLAHRRNSPRLRWVAWFALPAVALWLASLGFTAGGLFYSLRVLSPTLALLAIPAGVALAQLTTARQRRIATGVLLVLAVESLPKSLVLPENPYRTPVREWLVAGDRLNCDTAAAGTDLRRALATLPADSHVLTESAGLQPLLELDHRRVIPLWSPQVAWLFDERLAPAQLAARWRASGLRTVVLTRGSVGADFLFRHARWRAPWFTLKETASVGPYLVLEITAGSPASEVTRSALDTYPQIRMH